jgi:glycosyltransferase involved in cell wall biosynthesis
MTFPHKNHMTLLRALAHLRAKKQLRIPLVMTGRPYEPYWPVLERSIVQLGLADQVRVLGSVSELALAALYRAAHAVVFPSSFEGLGLPLLEALKHRTPIIAANATAIPEVVGRAGILFEPFDYLALAETMDRAWREPGWVRQPLEHAEKQLELFDWGNARRTYMALYRKIMGAGLNADDERLLQAAGT